MKTQLGLMVLILGLAGALSPRAYANREIQLGNGDSITLLPGELTSSTRVSCGGGVGPDSAACANYLIDREHTSDSNRMLELTRACGGNFGSECVRYGAERVHTSDHNHLVAIASKCKGVPNVRCTAYIVERAHTLDIEHLKAALTGCQFLSDEICVKNLTERAHTTDLQQMVGFAAACAAAI